MLTIADEPRTVDVERALRILTAAGQTAEGRALLQRSGAADLILAAVRVVAEDRP